MNKTKHFRLTALHKSAKSMVSLMLLLIAMLMPQGAWAANHYDAGYESTATTYSAAGIKFKITAVRMYNYQGNNSQFRSNPLVTITAGGHTHTFYLGSLTSNTGKDTFYYNGEGNENPYKGSGSFSKVTYQQTVDGIPVKAYFDNQKNEQRVSTNPDKTYKDNGDGSSKWCTADLTIEIGVQTAAMVTIAGNWGDYSDGINKTESYSWPFSIPKHTCNSDNATSTTYPCLPATCEQKATYYKSCSFCGAKQSGTFTSGSAKGHGHTNGYTASYDWSGTAASPTCKFTLKCNDCKDSNNNPTVIVNSQSITTTTTGTYGYIKQTAHQDTKCTEAGYTTYQAAGKYSDSNKKNASYTETTESNTNNTNTYTIAMSAHPYSDGICIACNGYETPAGNGTSSSPYLIGNQGNLLWFADKCTNTNATRNFHAKQTANIVYTQDSNWWGLGSSAWNYRGTYDGDGHTISGLKCNANYSSASIGMFGIIGSGGKVMNLGLLNVSFSGRYGSQIGAFAYSNFGTITNCYATGSISGQYTAGISYGNMATISNCYSAVQLKKYNSASWTYPIADKNATNCYSTSSSSPSAEFTSGEVCYKLNGGNTSGIWKQTIGTDQFPVFDKTHATVYSVQNIKCDGVTTYSVYTNNSNQQPTVDAHSMTEHAATDPTCTENGNYLYYTCSQTCCSGKYYKDGDIHTTDAYANFDATVREKLNHDYGAGVWAWGDDCHSATCTITCSRDANHKASASVTLGNGITSVKLSDPTSCAEKGKTRYSATATMEGTQYSDTKEIADITIPHTFATDDESQSKCTVCNHGFFRYTADAKVEPKANSLQNAKGENIYDSENHTFANEVGVMEFKEPLAIIDEDAFNQTGLTGSPIIPNTVTTIGEGAFYQCRKLTGDLTIPNSVTSIGKWAFTNCTGFNGKLTLSDKITEIPYCAFENCPFTGVIIPKSVTNIGKAAFSQWFGSNYTSIEMQSVPQFTGDAFYQVDCPITVVLSDDSYVYTGENPYFPEVTSVTYTRENIKNEWGTIVAPFKMGNGDDYDLYTLSEVSEDKLTLAKVSGTIEAGTPVIFRVKDTPAPMRLRGEGDDEPLSITFKAATNAVNGQGTLAGSAAGGLQLIGTYQAKELSADDYFISNNKFWRVADFPNATVKAAPFRAYLHSTGAGAKASSLSISIADGNATAIDTLNAITEGAAEYYDLSGKRILKLQKGINIVKYGNGKTKKVVIK